MWDDISATVVQSLVTAAVGFVLFWLRHGWGTRRIRRRLLAELDLLEKLDGYPEAADALRPRVDEIVATFTRREKRRTAWMGEPKSSADDMFLDGLVATAWVLMIGTVSFLGTALVMGVLSMTGQSGDGLVVTGEGDVGWISRAVMTGFVVVCIGAFLAMMIPQLIGPGRRFVNDVRKLRRQKNLA